MTFWISALIFLASVGAGLRTRSKRRSRARKARTRRVEQPNSHYAAPGVRRLANLERWQQIPMDRLHPINRKEVDRLVDLVRVTGDDVLSASERQFLDNMQSRYTPES